MLLFWDKTIAVDIIAAVVIDWIIGDPYWFPHPVIYIGKLIKNLENIFRKRAKDDKQLKLYGGIIVLIVCISSFIIPFIMLVLSTKNIILFHFIDIVFLSTALAAKSLHVEAEKVYLSLKNKNIEDARKKLSYIVGRDTQQLSDCEIIRADVETVAENTSDGVIAPILFALIGGAPLAMLYKGINTMDSMLGYMNEKYRYIGFFPAKTDDAANYIPARISGALICIAAPITGGNILKSFRIMARDRHNHKSPNCGYPESAAAGAMGIELGGTNSYFGEKVYKPTIGDKVNELSLKNIMDCIRLMYAAEILLMVIVSAAAFI